MLNITPIINTNSSIPLYMQIYEYIKNEIVRGNIPSGSKLPSIRALSGDMNVSKNTVNSAYQQLLAEGYIVSKNKSGFFIQNIDKELLKRLDENNTRIEKNTQQLKEIINYDFSNGQVDLNSFPFATFRKIMSKSILPEEKDLLLYGDHKGDLELRSQIAKYIYQSRGVICSPQQILIGAGTQQSLSILSLILSKISKSIAFEDPGYIGARLVFQHNGFYINPIPVADDGINLEILKKSKSKIMYITPSHQFPLGTVMPISKRLELLKWASNENAFIIEDDYDGEFRYKGKPIPALQSLDSKGKVIYLGTFSKSLMPSMRISYLVLPENILNIYEENFRIYEQPVPRINQKALQIFIQEGHWHKHLKKCRSIYKKKQDTLINSINKYFGDKAKIIGADSGLHILIRVSNDMDESELLNSARNKGIKVNPTSIYYMNEFKNNPPLIFIGFAGINVEDIPKGINLLSKTWL
ncbi:PLP-dependent aminotransferase family protein [Clostridium sediminicola]|uniref:MocR-like pyridoxine biosynthesis transcription factor PdxR n=1 Tax=Clostridium sediminicola TaxID=3114879 RepID=UPI0031F25A02